METAAQLRAARAMAKLTRSELAKAAGISEETVKRLETAEGRISANTSTVGALAKALEAQGVVFVPENGGPAGVRFRSPGDEVTTFRIESKMMGKVELILPHSPGPLDNAKSVAVRRLKNNDAPLMIVTDNETGQVSRIRRDHDGNRPAAFDETTNKFIPFPDD